MSETLQTIRSLVSRGSVRISDHGYNELSADDLTAREVVDGLTTAELVEDYPDYHRGPCVLVLQRDHENQPIHAVWGIPLGKTEPAVLITAYRPDPDRWDESFTKRQKR